MGQQHRKVTKRRRRAEYIKRKKEQLKLSKAAPTVQLAKKVVKTVEESPEEEKKAPAKKAPAKKTTATAKKAPAKKAPAKKKEAAE